MVLGFQRAEVHCCERSTPSLLREPPISWSPCMWPCKHTVEASQRSTAGLTFVGLVCGGSPVPLQGALRRVVAAQSRVTNRLTIEQWPAVLQRCSSSKNTDGASRRNGSFPFGVGWVAGGASDEDPLSSHCSAPASGDEPSAELAPVGGPPHPPQGHAGRPIGMRDRSSEASGTVLRAMPRVGRAARQYSEWPASQPASQPASCMLQPLSILHT